MRIKLNKTSQLVRILLMKFVSELTEICECMISEDTYVLNIKFGAGNIKGVSLSTRV